MERHLMTVEEKVEQALDLALARTEFWLQSGTSGEHAVRAAEAAQHLAGALQSLRVVSRLSIEQMLDASLRHGRAARQAASVS